MQKLVRDSLPSGFDTYPNQCLFLTASFPGSSLFLLLIFNLVCRYAGFLCNEESKHSIEDWLNLTCFRTFTALHWWKKHVTKEPFQFILETSYRWFIKAIDQTFFGFTGVITHLGCWENTWQACNHERKASDLQACQVFSKHPKWVITPVNPLKVWSIALIK